jgi:hypothetical protein
VSEVKSLRTTSLKDKQASFERDYIDVLGNILSLYDKQPCLCTTGALVYRSHNGAIS